jgi:hypothetical protein
VINVRLEEAIAKQKLVKRDNQAVIAARAAGIAFGDE